MVGGQPLGLSLVLLSGRNITEIQKTLYGQKKGWREEKERG